MPNVAPQFKDALALALKAYAHSALLPMACSLPDIAERPVLAQQPKYKCLSMVVVMWTALAAPATLTSRPQWLLGMLAAAGWTPASPPVSAVARHDTGPMLAGVSGCLRLQSDLSCWLLGQLPC